MRFGESFLEEIKARVRPSDVVGRHVKLKRQGREFAGLSPFTNEKTPSFFVNDEKGFYHCFSSGKHGDAISFLMEVEGLSFPEAVEKLAEMAGLEMPKVDPDAERRAAQNKKTISWMEQAQIFFEKSLYRDMGSEARDYLKRRGLTKTAATNFGMGFAPSHFSALKDELMQQGASARMLIEAGLIIRLVAFGGRAMEKDAKAKYLNSPETPIFQKGQLLYNYHRARKAISNPKNNARGMIVAEGYMDVIALSRAGFEHAVAPMGTALTEDQLALLWRSGPEPVLCFDGDNAGQRAAFRSIERALPHIRPGQSLRFALLPKGQDPDDLIKAKGKTAMQDILDGALPLVEMLWQRELSAEPLTTPEAKAGLKSRIFSALNEISHEDVRTQYQTALLDRFDLEFGRQRRSKKGQWNSNYAQKKASPAMKAAMKVEAINSGREKKLIGAILLWPDLLPHVDETLFELKFSTPSCAEMQRSLLSYWRVTKAVEKSSLNAHIDAEGLNSLSRDFARDRLLIKAAMGGADADLDTRTALWQDEAAALTGQAQTDDDNGEARSLMADAIRDDNSDALKRQMRAVKSTQE